MRIPDNIKKCVVYIGTEETTPIKRIKWRGTGFFVSFPSKLADSSSPNRGFIYLITAKHVAARIAGNDFYVRVNSTDGKSVTFKGEKNHTWWFHPNEVWQTDVAAFPMLQEDIIRKLDYESIPAANFVTDEMRLNEGIGEGDEVFTVGLFSKHTGNERNNPIIRMGNIALISDEMIHTPKFGNMDAYLIEMHSIGGVSGSPVFVLKPIPLVVETDNGPEFVMTARSSLRLLGLVHGHWDIATGDFIDIEDDDISKISSVNVGVAVVIPAQKIMDTLNCKEFTDFRAKAEAAFIAKYSPNPD